MLEVHVTAAWPDSGAFRATLVFDEERVGTVECRGGGAPYAYDWAISGTVLSGPGADRVHAWRRGLPGSPHPDDPRIAVPPHLDDLVDAAMAQSLGGGGTTNSFL